MKGRVLKTIGVVMAMVMAVGMSVCAAPSPSGATYVVSGIGTAVDKDGKDVSSMVKKQDVPAEYQAAVAELKTEAGLKAALGDAYNANMVITDVFDVVVTGDVSFPLTLTFNVNGVTSSTKAQILHYNGSAWEKIDTTAGEGTLKGTFNSFSPVAIVVDKTTTTGATASPKTSAQSVALIALVGMFAVVAACGMKKRSMER